jgi:hypothetical protein
MGCWSMAVMTGSDEAQANAALDTGEAFQF